MNERGRRRKWAALVEADDAQKRFRDAREKRTLPNRRVSNNGNASEP